MFNISHMVCRFTKLPISGGMEPLRPLLYQFILVTVPPEVQVTPGIPAV
jgi:hypothetical protein